MKYIWEYENWTQFTWDHALINSKLLKLKKKQGALIALAKELSLKNSSEILIEEALKTSQIEGEKLSRDDVRSSVAKKLNIDNAGVNLSTKKSDGIVEILIKATQNFNEDIKDADLHSWHAALFPTGYSGLSKITVAGWRTGTQPMQVVSGSPEKQRIHFEAPPSKKVPAKMNTFINWFNTDSKDIDGILRAAIAHFWFITIHPYDDGNGRLARCITDKALAQEENTSMRLYSLSTSTEKNKNEYYNVLEQSQKSGSDITNWILFFLKIFDDSITQSEKIINKSFFTHQYNLKLLDKNLNKRQLKVINKLLAFLPKDFEGGLTTKKYSVIAKISVETAKRDLKELLTKNIILKNSAGGRSTSYRLNRDL